MRYVEVANSFGRVYGAASLSSILRLGGGGATRGGLAINSKSRHSRSSLFCVRRVTVICMV